MSSIKSPKKFYLTPSDYFSKYPAKFLPKIPLQLSSKYSNPNSKSKSEKVKSSPLSLGRNPPLLLPSPFLSARAVLLPFPSLTSPAGLPLPPSPAQPPSRPSASLSLCQRTPLARRPPPSFPHGRSCRPRASSPCCLRSGRPRYDSTPTPSHRHHLPYVIATANPAAWSPLCCADAKASTSPRRARRRRPPRRRCIHSPLGLHRRQHGHPVPATAALPPRP